ncbi:squamosa promoter-binding-like protein 6 [Dorcoceras hygrometricum]|uniref:Squamosa promoter-binding-like protein 6 n=1 Tax=Dorcoceras hygrometricum TaxID=472368 RepID=A0A2Z7BXW1_9LAMI|nr:squamosa promoter-binding-like protein 6 [Dorcoceras hygrometricum]
MESLSYGTEGKGLAVVQLDDACVRSGNVLKRWGRERLCVEPILPDIMRKFDLSEESSKNLGYFTDDGSTKSFVSTSTNTSTSFMEFGARFSTPAMKADNQNLVPTSFMSDNLAARKDRSTYQFDVENSVLCSLEHSVAAKRARTSNSLSLVPVCQVLDCNKDLSSSKDYHKRHKVCDLHSKSSVVIVDGIQQRFCQQCSRFHLLREFDEGKRSCRKRLAGHNERRRKPQLDAHLGSSYFATDLSRTPFLFPKFLQVGSFHGDPMNHRFGPSLSNSLLNKNRLFSAQEVSAESNSSGALSLLSSQSQNLPSNSTDVSVKHPLIFLDNQHSKNFAESFSNTTLKNFTSNVLPEVLDAGVSIGLDIRQDILSQEPKAPEGANTVDLLQLSFHLQRVEHQRYSTEVNLENGHFRHTAIT